MKILFCSAERDLLMTYSRLLKAEGYDVATAFDGPQLTALLTLEDTFVILDPKLPRLDPKRMLQYMQDGRPLMLLMGERRIPAAYSELLPAEAFLFYPFSPDDLLGRVKMLLSRKETEA